MGIYMYKFYIVKYCSEQVIILFICINLYIFSMTILYDIVYM